MDATIFLTIYILFILITVTIEIYILANNKLRYLRVAYRPIKAICDDPPKDDSIPCSKIIANELDRFYNEYTQEMPQLKKFYSNVVVWLDAVIFRIDIGEKRASILTPHIQMLKQARDLLAKENPFNKCEKYQQGILHDIEKIKTSDNEIIVQNIINRTYEEFLRLSSDIKKNHRLNIVSIAIGIIGVFVSIFMAIIQI